MIHTKSACSVLHDMLANVNTASLLVVFTLESGRRVFALICFRFNKISDTSCFLFYLFDKPSPSPPPPAFRI